MSTPNTPIGQTQGLGQTFKGDFTETCGNKFLPLSMGGKQGNPSARIGGLMNGWIAAFPSTVGERG